MRIVRGLDQYPPDAPPSVVAQGTFDGVHLGHQAVIRTAVGRARALSVRPVAVTFDPNPLAVLRPTDAPPELLPLDERLERMAELGPEVCLVIPFTAEFSRVEAEAYVAEVLLGLLRAREIVVGFNHAFGRGARGTPELLTRVAGPAGVRVHVVAPLEVDGVAVSSTTIREALRHGDVGRAQSLLGRPYTLRGVVARGAARGRLLGFPTANLAVPSDLLLADGVYAARAAWGGESAPAVVNVGVRPTFDGATRLVEAHLLDAAPDLYDRQLALAFLGRIRPERRFDSLEALRTQIADDVATARRVLGPSP
ncbi:MAG TPA: bifunctional riboflavin kinase/FAD synthetase [Methylomirabilota bacterium]|jgi:riboflavin kinase/FMN adenylyltransferase